MGTFLFEPFTAARSLFPTAADAELSSTAAASADDAEFSSIHHALLLAMNDDDDVGGTGPPPGAPFDADADDAADATLLAFFAAQEHDHHHQAHDDAMMVPFPVPPQVFADLPLNPGTGSVFHGFQSAPAAPAAAADDGPAARPPPAKRRRRRQPSDCARGEGSSSLAQAQAPAPAKPTPSRRVWVRERSTEWWDRLSGPSCPDAEFRLAFRMSRATFAALCDALGGAVAKEDTALRAAIPARRRVAVCVWRLATAEPLREVSRRFGLGISTCHSIVIQVYRAIAAVLRPTAIRWPEPDYASAAGFEAATGIPGVVGAVYTTRVPVVTPKANVAAYYDRRLTERNNKASYSVAVQAVVDADGAFTDVWIDPGSLSDAAVLGRSALGEAVGGRLGEQRLVGGTSYPLTDGMLVPYAHRNLTWTEHALNERVSAARGVARDAVRRLKARWRCLQRRTEVKMQDLPSMIAACCVLHNFCERAGEGIDPDLMQYELDDDDDVVAHQDAVPSAAAVQARDMIAHGLLHVAANEPS